MKQPIPTKTGELSAIIGAMLMKQGKTEFTMSLDEFKELNIADYCIETTGEVVDGKIISLTATLVYEPRH